MNKNLWERERNNVFRYFVKQYIIMYNNCKFWNDKNIGRYTLMDLLDFWRNNQIFSIVIICSVIVLFVFFIILLSRIFSNRLNQEEKEEKESQKEDQKAYKKR